MGGVELIFLLALLLTAGKKGPAAAPSPTGTPPIPAPTPSVPVPGPQLPVAVTTPAAATLSPSATPSEAKAATRAANAPQPFPQTVPPGLPGFPGPGWKPFVPTPPAVSTRAAQLLPTLWATGAGTHKTEQTAGQWTTYLATKMGATGQIKGVTAWKLAALTANA